MKKGIIKVISTISAAAMFISAAPAYASVTTAFADDVPVLNLSVNGDYYVLASSVANGDVSVRLKVYLENTGDEAYQAAKVAFVSDSDANFVESTDGTGKVSRNIIFKNLSSQTEDKVEDSVYNSTVMETKSGVQYKMPYVTPFCFGSISKTRKGYYVYSASGVSANRYAEPMNADKIDENGNLIDEKIQDIGNLGTHSYMMSDGNGGVYFTLTERNSANSNPVTKTLSTADGSLKMEKLKSGGVIFRYSYIDQQSYAQKNGSIKYPYFDSSLPKDQPLTGDSDNWLWVEGSKSVKVLGEKDEFSLCEVDAVIKKGTAAGDYTVSLDPKETYLTAVDANGKNFPRSLENGKITATKAVIHVVNDSVPETPANNDTQFERKPLPIGDVNYDGAIDSKDAVLVLKSYAEELVNGKPTVDDTGDVNGDKNIDSKDAVIILKYYAEKLASGSSISMTDFVKK